jgi:hypothetical protein
VVRLAVLLVDAQAAQFVLEVVAGVVIEPGHNLDFGAVGQLPVNEVGLPPLVRLLGGEPDVRRLRPLLRLGDD